MPTVEEIDAEIARREKVKAIDAEILRRQYQSESEIPIDEEVGLPFAPKPQQPDPSMGDIALGVGESALTLATGATGGALGYMGGIASQLPQEIASGEFGTQESAGRVERAAMEGSSALTYAPRTETGQDIVESIGEFAEPLVAVAPQLSVAMPIARSPLVSAYRKIDKKLFDETPYQNISTKQSNTKIAIAKQIANGEKSPDLAKYTINAKGKIAKDPLANNAIKQGFDPAVIQPIKGSTPLDKIKIGEMVKVRMRAAKDKEWGMSNRQHDVAGRTAGTKLAHLIEENKKAGESIDNIAKGLKGKSVDLSEPMAAFSNGLDSFGVAIKPTKKGFKPDFTNTSLPRGDRAPIAEIVRQIARLSKGGWDAAKAHELKQIIRRNVKYGAQKTALSDDATAFLKEVSRKVDESLDGKFKNYDKANVKYADTIEILNEWRDLAGRKNQLKMKGIDRVIGNLLNRMDSNAQSSQRVINASDNLDAIAAKYGMPTKESTKLQIMVANEMDRVLKPAARTSFEGRIGAAMEQGAKSQQTAVGLAVDVGKAGYEKLKGINEASALKALGELVKETK